MTLAKKWLFAVALGAGSLVSSAALGQIVVTPADFVPAASGRVATTEVAYRPYYARRGYYAPNRAFYGPRYGYGYGRVGSYYRPYPNGVYARPYYGGGYYGFGSPYYGYTYGRPAFRYGVGWY